MKIVSRGLKPLLKKKKLIILLSKMIKSLGLSSIGSGKKKFMSFLIIFISEKETI